MPVYGGIEAGGTKFVCAVGTGPDDVRALERFPTTTPDATIGRAIDFLRAHDVEAVGIGSFGPVDPHPDSPTWGYITTTPKPGWAHVDFGGAVGRALGVPVAFDTDVNVAALGEHRWGAGQGLDTFLYLTVGTGIGGGGFVRGRRMRGLVHPEIGHLLLPRVAGDGFAGTCPYHGDCLEGLASGPALEARWGARAETFEPDHPAWGLEAEYLGRALVNLVVTLSPERILLGGGVMSAPDLLPRVRTVLRERLGGYVAHPTFTDADRLADYVVAPRLGARAGVLGALALAHGARRAAPSESP